MGAVYDINGAVIVNGTRIIAAAPAGETYEATTNIEGTYELKLPLGIYKIKVSAPGFCSYQLERYRVVNSTYGKMALDFVLEVGGGQEGCKHEIIIPKPKRKTDKRAITVIE
jgi:hypothetical protein